MMLAWQEYLRGLGLIILEGLLRYQGKGWNVSQNFMNQQIVLLYEFGISVYAKTNCA